jgi:hypothetical protein
MTAATAALVLSLMGQAIDTVYTEQARCAGVARPKPVPAIRVLSREKFRCGSASPTGWCTGLHTRRGITSTRNTAVIEHELFHHVLCQLGDCDARHRSPLWDQCRIPTAVHLATDEAADGPR